MFNDPSPPPIVWPAQWSRDTVIPKDWEVWTFGDVEGVRSTLVEVLQQSGLIDADERWVAPPHTALVGLGDYIDRGEDSLGVLYLLQRLAAEAKLAESRVLLVRGNHEQMLLDAFAGDQFMFDVWLNHGGRPFLTSLGIGAYRSAGGRTVDCDIVMPAVARRQPWLEAWLTATTLPWVAWRDLLFVHGGLVGNQGFDDLLISGGHLWIDAQFLNDPQYRSDDYAAYREAGVNRVVVGHTPQYTPTLYQHGQVLALDTTKGETLTLARIEPIELAASTFYTVTRHMAPDRPRAS